MQIVWNLLHCMDCEQNMYASDTETSSVAFLFIGNGESNFTHATFEETRSVRVTFSVSFDISVHECIRLIRLEVLIRKIHRILLLLDLHFISQQACAT